MPEKARKGQGRTGKTKEGQGRPRKAKEDQARPCKARKGHVRLRMLEKRQKMARGKFMEGQ